MVILTLIQLKDKGPFIERMEKSSKELGVIIYYKQKADLQSYNICYYSAFIHIYNLIGEELGNLCITHQIVNIYMYDYILINMISVNNSNERISEINH